VGSERALRAGLNSASLFQYFQANALAGLLSDEQKIKWLERMLDEEPEFIEWLKERVDL
jgi:hypothetical protein